MSDARRKVERSRVALLVGTVGLALGGGRGPVWAQARLPEVTVYKNPT